MRPPRIYVSGPMSGAPGSNYLQNLRLGIDCGRILMKMGCVPFVPHNSALTGLVYTDIPHEEWIAFDLSWVEACDALIRLPGVSGGADKEAAHALLMSIPVFEMSRIVVTVTERAVWDAAETKSRWFFDQWLRDRYGFRKLIREESSCS